MATKSKSARLYDISKLRIQISVNRRVATVRSANGEQLESCLLEPEIDLTTDVGKREASFLVLDKVLSSPKNNELPERLLYNPVTKQVARFSTPNTITYSDNDAIDIPSEGLKVCISEEIIEVDSREIPQMTIDYHKLTKILASHREH
ncbi:MAG: hypothetical protein ACKOW9_05375 [Candidatus Paceibacterota bacterium]